jgi:hypothetical protein
MKAYLTKDGGYGSIEFTLPDPRPKSGEVYAWRTTVCTAGGTAYGPGDTMELLEMTFESPHGYHCSSGNWRVRCKVGVSIWSTVEDSISRGFLVRIKEAPVLLPSPTIWERLGGE